MRRLKFESLEPRLVLSGYNLSDSSGKELSFEGPIQVLDIQHTTKSPRLTLPEFNYVQAEAAIVVTGWSKEQVAVSTSTHYVLLDQNLSDSEGRIWQATSTISISGTGRILNTTIQVGSEVQRKYLFSCCGSYTSTEVDISHSETSLKLYASGTETHPVNIVITATAEISQAKFFAFANYVNIMSSSVEITAQAYYLNANGVSDTTVQHDFGFGYSIEDYVSGEKHTVSTDQFQYYGANFNFSSEATNHRILAYHDGLNESTRDNTVTATTTTSQYDNTYGRVFTTHCVVNIDESKVTDTRDHFKREDKTVNTETTVAGYSFNLGGTAHEAIFAAYQGLREELLST